MAEKLTKEMIFAVADQIAAEGERVRVAEVLRRIGYGSLSTITPAVREWKELQKPAAPVEKAVVPQALADRLTALGSELWTQAQAVAEEGMAKEREALEAYRAEMEDQQLETAEYADALNEANEALREKNEALQLQVKELQAEKDGLSNLLKTANEELIAAKTREQSAGKHMDDLKELLAEREAERESTNQTIQQQAAEIAQLRQDLAVINERQKLAEQQLTEERAAVKEIQAAADRRLTDERAAREQAQKNFEASRERQQAAEVKAALLEGEVNALRGQVAAPAAAKKTEPQSKQGGKSDQGGK